MLDQLIIWAWVMSGVLFLGILFAPHKKLLSSVLKYPELIAAGAVASIILSVNILAGNV